MYNKKEKLLLTLLLVGNVPMRLVAMLLTLYIEQNIPVGGELNNCDFSQINFAIFIFPKNCVSYCLIGF